MSLALHSNMHKPECQYLVFMIQHPQMSDVVCSPVCLHNVLQEVYHHIQCILWKSRTVSLLFNLFLSFSQVNRSSRPLSCLLFFLWRAQRNTHTQTFALYLLMRSDFISVTLFSKAPPVSYANDLISSTGIALIAACWVGTLLAMRTNELRTLWTLNIKKYIYASEEHCKEISRGTFIFCDCVEISHLDPVIQFQ